MDGESTKIGRREFGALALAGGLFPTAAMAGEAGDFPPPTLEFAFGARVTLARPQELGTRGGGRSRFVPITGGTISGPKLEGVVLPGGGDWQTIGEDGVTAIHARYLLQAKDGTVIDVDNPGVRVATPEVIARLTAGEDLSPSLYYFRTTPRFEVAAGPHDWLRRHVFVCQGARHPDSVELRFFKVS